MVGVGRDATAPGGGLVSATTFTAASEMTNGSARRLE